MKVITLKDGVKRHKNIVFHELDNGCWPCVSHKARTQGYVTITVSYTNHRLHKYLYELSNGKVPDGHVVRHLCNNPGCCNPKHLEVGTNQENMDDMKRAKRQNTPKRTKEQFQTRRVVQLTKGGELVKIHDTASPMGFAQCHIVRCCKGERKSTGGFRWMYYEDFFK